MKGREPENEINELTNGVIGFLWYFWGCCVWIPKLLTYLYNHILVEFPLLTTERILMDTMTSKS